MIAPILALTAIAFAPVRSRGAIEINVDAKDGESVSTERTFKVTVQSSSPINQVEFYVEDDLRSTDSSTPYEFKIDSLAEKEGPLKLKFAAYASEGENASKTITIKIDNGLDKGADFYVGKAIDALSISKWDDAIRACRVALKAKPGYNPARIAMARGFMGKGVMDQAQKYAEDTLVADKNYLEAAELLSAINLKKAFTTFRRGGESKGGAESAEMLPIIGTALKSAVENRRKVQDAAVDKLGPVTDANAMQYADLAIRTNRYPAAVSALSPIFRKDTRNQAIANRLAFAQMRAGRFDDAMLTLKENARQNSLDAYGFALQAVIAAERGDTAVADESIRQAVLSDSDDLGVRTAQAYIAIERGRVDTLRKLASNLARDEGQRTEVNYYLAILYNMVGDYAMSQDAFERCVLAEPTNYDMFVQRGNESLSLVASGRLERTQTDYHVMAAKMFFETALAAKPESAEALCGIALVNMTEKKSVECLKYARAAVGASPNYAAGQYTLSMVCSVIEAELRATAAKIRTSSRDGNLTSDQNSQINQLLNDAANFGKEAKTASDNAGKIDTVNLAGRELPRLPNAHQYFMRHGRIPQISPPK